MERKINYSKLIDRYLDGDLQDQELTWFERELATNPELKGELRLHDEVNRAIREKDVLELREQLELIHEEVETSQKKTIAKKIIRSKYSRIAAATVAILIATGFFLHNILDQPMSYDELFTAYYEPTDLPALFRSDGNMAEKEFYRAITLFNNKDYSEALVLFEKIVSVDNSKIDAKFMKGMTEMEVEEFLKASNSFQGVIDHQDNLYVDQAEWFLGLCYLKLNNPEKARMQFSKIADGGISPKRDEAKEILQGLDKR